MKLTLEHLAPYLPYGLKVKKEELIYWLSDSDGICRGEDNYHSISIGRSLNLNNGTIKPILRPLSDLTKEIEHNRERFLPISKLGSYSTSEIKWLLYKIERYDIEYKFAQKLFEWHFDVFGLIEQGLAINMNDL